MTLQFDSGLRNNRAAQIQATIGASGSLKIFSGAEPANAAAADPSGLLATITLPATFLSSASGTTTISGTWSTTGSAAGSAQSFRMYDGSAVCRLQGNTTTDLVLNNPSIAIGQTVSVSQFSFTDGNQ